MPNRRQAIIWTNANPIHWRIYAPLGGDELTHCGLVTPNGIADLGQHWIRYVTCSVPNHYRKRCLHIDIWTLGNKCQWNLNKMWRKATVFENDVCQGATILRHWFVKVTKDTSYLTLTGVIWDVFCEFKTLARYVVSAVWRKLTLL